MRLDTPKVLLALSAFLLTAAMVRADSLTGNGSWQTWSARNLIQGSNPTPGIPYWNNYSGDGSRYNIGWCLAGGGNCKIPSPPGNLPYFGPSGGGAPANFEFKSDGHAVVATLEAAITNSGPLDTFGWYNINTNGSFGPLTPLFSAAKGTGKTPKTFMPGSSDYGFYIEQDQGASGQPFSANYFFFMDSAKNSVTGYPNPSDKLQHFAIFDPPVLSTSEFYIGAVDTRACGVGGIGTCVSTTKFDYNDFVVKLDTVNNPEPGSLGLLAAGLAMFAAFRLRRRNNG